MTTISLLIPCYNEAENVAQILKVCQQTFINSQASIEYIFINDGSKDATFQELKKLCQTYPQENLKIINFSRNFGKEAAMYAGLQHATGDYTSIIDADLQQDPQYVLEMVEFLESNPDFDMVACYQEKRKEPAPFKIFKNLFYYLINSISETEFVAHASDFRTMRRNVVEAILSLKENHRFSKGIFSWVGFNTHYQPYQVKDRQHGKTSWSFTKLFSYALSGFVGFSTAPLKIATLLGSALSGLSFLYLFYIVWQWIISGNDVPGFTTIVSLILFSSGIQMILMGILGEYLAHTFLQVKERPIYIVRDFLETQPSTKN